MAGDDLGCSMMAMNFDKRLSPAHIYAHSMSLCNSLPTSTMRFSVPPKIAHKPHRVGVLTFVAHEVLFTKIQNLTGQVTKGDRIACGGLSDVYKGKWTTPDTGQSTDVSENAWLLCDCHIHNGPRLLSKSCVVCTQQLRNSTSSRRSGYSRSTIR
jgi:hypothetical protein